MEQYTEFLEVGEEKVQIQSFLLQDKTGLKKGKVSYILHQPFPHVFMMPAPSKTLSTYPVSGQPALEYRTLPT